MKNFVNRFKRITYKVIGLEIAAGSEGVNFSQSKIKLAIKQAFSIWSAYAPLIFEEVTGKNTDITIEFINQPNPTAALGTTYGKYIEINTTNKFFIDKENEKDNPPVQLIGPFDLIAVLAHEIGHALGLDHPPSPSEALMNNGMSPGRVLRQLYQYDIDQIVTKYGKIATSDIISTNLEDYADINTAFEGLHFLKESFGVQLDGPTGNKLSLYVFMPNTKNRKISSINLKYTTALANTFVNSIELYDGIIPLQHFYLNSTINRGWENPFKDWDIKLGILEKKKIKHGILAKINIEFRQIEQHWDVGIVQFKAISANSLFEIVVDLPDFENIGLSTFS